MIYREPCAFVISGTRDYVVFLACRADFLELVHGVDPLFFVAPLPLGCFKLPLPPLTVLCPAVLDTRTLALLGERLLVVTVDRGPGAPRVRARLGAGDISVVSLRFTGGARMQGCFPAPGS